jgi:filamentous hemagglutinin family protein
MKMTPYFSYLSNGNKVFAARLFRGAPAVLLFFTGLTVLDANPAGGTVASGSAAISGTGTSSVTINQASKIAIINWNSFSIDQGELTTFIQPTSSSAVLNRVNGGGISNIDGTLSANGQVYLINGNGILVGKSGVVNTAGFTASTQDISNGNFLSGTYQFTGNSVNGVQNLGAINALGGSIYLIGHTVDNEGSLTASNGTVGLAAGNNVLIKPSGTQHVFVKAVSSPTGDSGADAVNNNGAINATAAELQAANGNIYALAINNGGTIRATTVQNQGGHILLTSDSGVIVNTGTIDASATAANGTGGQITLKSSKTDGTVVNHGQVVARGGQGGSGGTVDLSGANLDFTGGVDLTAVGGTKGSLLLDPSSITIDSTTGNGTVTTTGTTTTYTPVPNFPSPPGPVLNNGVLQAQLAIANVIVDGVNNVTVAAPVTWTSNNSLTLETTATNGTIVINAALTGKSTTAGDNSALIINAIGTKSFITTGAGGTVNVDDFTLQNGTWQQIGTLPAFNVSNDFQLLNTSTFERFAGGDGKPVNIKKPADSPYQIADIYGLQGIGSPSDTLLANSYILNNDINFDGVNVTNSTIYWNGGNGSAASTVSGAGWVPIGEGGKTVKPFTGTFDGAGHVIAGYYLYRPNDNLSGLFGEVQGTVKNVNLDVAGSQGINIGGLLIGRLVSGTVQDCNITGDFAEPAPDTAGAGTTGNQSQLTGNLGVSAAFGGVVGENMTGAKIINCTSDITYDLLDGNGGLIGLGGVVGVNYGTVTDCFSSGGASTAVNVTLATVSTTDYKNNSIALGGLVGANYGTINGGESEGTVTADGSLTATQASIVSGPGNFYIGGFVGVNYGTIDSTVTVKDPLTNKNVQATYQAMTSDNVTGPVGGDVNGGTGSYYVGGFAGANYGTIQNAYSAAQFTDTLGAVSMVGGVVTGNGNLNGTSAGSTGALGNYVVGGFVGGNFKTIIKCGTEDTVIANGNVAGIANVTTTKNGVTTTVPATVNISSSNSLQFDSYFVGGLVGLNGTGSSITGSFNTDITKTIAYKLDPTTSTPTFEMSGDTFTLFSANDLNATNNPVVQSNGNITGGAGYYLVGGLVGGNFGTIGTSYEAGDVTAIGTTTQSNSFYIGGLAGLNRGNISNAYALGNVSSQTMVSGNETGLVGGLVAAMYGGSVTDAYSIGTLTGGITRGGLIGLLSSGSVSASFWNMDNNPGLTYSGGGKGVTGETTAAMQTDNAGIPAHYTLSIYGVAKWNFKTIWTVGNIADYPTLQGVP